MKEELHDRRFPRSGSKFSRSMSRGDIGGLKSHVHNSVWADYNGRIEGDHHHHHTQMTQEQANLQETEPQSSQESNPPPIQQSPPASTRLGILTSKVVNNIVEVLKQLLWAFDWLLWAVMGKLGRTVYLTIQDAIALSIILRVPGLIYKSILGNDFSGYDVCMLENVFDTSCVACYVIVTFKYLFWILIAGRLSGRLLINIKDYWKEFKDSFNS